MKFIITFITDLIIASPVYAGGCGPGGNGGGSSVGIGGGEGEGGAGCGGHQCNMPKGQ